jgi:anti-sigma factor RsiW
MDCALDRQLLEGYLDGELGFERTLEVEAHLASCVGCSQEVRGWKQVRGALQRPEMYRRAPDGLAAKIRAGLPQAERREREGVPLFHRWLWAGGGAAFATAALLIAFAISRPANINTDGALNQEIVGNHVRSLVTNHLMDVISTDQHTVKPWFDGKLDFAPPVRDFVSQGYPLAGGRLDYVDNRTVAVLIYHRALHPINLYIWPAAAGSSANSESMRAETIHGYNVISWSKDGFEFRAISDLNTDELRAFAQLVSS